MKDRIIVLASSGSFITEGDLSFLPKPVRKMKIARIITASKGVQDTSYIKRHAKRMAELGYDFEDVDIEGKDYRELNELLSNRDLIFMEGGNSFYLLKAVRESGFEEIIKELIGKGVIYVGASAGSYIACPTIEMATWKKPQKYDRCGVTDFTAMNLVPFLVVAHYEPKFDETLREKIPNAKYKTRILTDDQAIAVINGEARLIGKGEEIKVL